MNSCIHLKGRFVFIRLGPDDEDFGIVYNTEGSIVKYHRPNGDSSYIDCYCESDCCTIISSKEFYKLLNKYYAELFEEGTKLFMRFEETYKESKKFRIYVTGENPFNTDIIEFDSEEDYNQWLKENSSEEESA